MEVNDLANRCCERGFKLVFGILTDTTPVECELYHAGQAIETSS